MVEVSTLRSSTIHPLLTVLGRQASKVQRNSWSDEESSTGNDVIRSVRQHRVEGMSVWGLQIMDNPDADISKRGDRAAVGHRLDSRQTSSASGPAKNAAKANKVTAEKGVATDPSMSKRDATLLNSEMRM